MRISDRAHVYKKTRTRIKYGRKKAALKIIWEVCFEKKMADRGAFDALPFAGGVRRLRRSEDFQGNIHERLYSVPYLNGGRKRRRCGARNGSDEGCRRYVYIYVQGLEPDRRRRTRRRVGTERDVGSYILCGIRQDGDPARLLYRRICGRRYG